LDSDLRAHVQSAFNIGTVVFKTITREMLDVWQQGIRAEAGDSPKVGEALERSGRSCRVSPQELFRWLPNRIEPSRLRASGLTLRTALLRLFAPANFDPRQLSYCVPLGSHQREGHHYLTVKTGKSLAKLGACCREVLTRGSSRTRCSRIPVFGD